MAESHISILSKCTCRHDSHKLNRVATVNQALPILDTLALLLSLDWIKGKSTGNPNNIYIYIFTVYIYILGGKKMMVSG